MENKELETWLKETKAKNLSKEDLKEVTSNLDTHFYFNVKRELGVVGTLYEHLFNQWQKEKEFSPKRGDRVLVFDGNEYDIEAIFLTKIEGAENPICTVDILTENEFLNNKPFYITCYKHMKPIPTEQPKETDFKSQVIELIEKRIKESDEKIQNNIKDNQLIFASAWQNYKTEANEILKAIENLC